MENNDNAEIDLDNNEELEEEDIYANLENNIANAKNQLNQVNNNKQSQIEEQENSLDEQVQEQNNNYEEDDEDDRLTYTLITLDLGDLIHIFEENNISFVDMLLLSKEDLKELQLKLYQRNRIHNFSVLFSKYAKNYSISEISDFFSFNQKFIFNSSIYDRVIMSQNQNDIWDNENNNENINDNNDEINDDDEYENENNNINENEINKQKDNYNLENINYSDYMNFMKNENNRTMYTIQPPKSKLVNNDNFEQNINNNINTNYNDIKYNTFNNNNYNNNYYLSKDLNEKNQIKQEANNIVNDIGNINSNDIKNNQKAKTIINPLINDKINSINSNKNKTKTKKETLQTNKIINPPKELKSKILVNKKQIQSPSNNQNSNTNNISNINNNTSNITMKKKSSNRINAVISKYLEIKQDADEFLERLNKKKTDSQNKYNKYNLLIKKKNITNNNVNIINNYKNIPMISSKKKISAKISNKPQMQNNNNEFNLNEDINLEYQKMNNQIDELEKLNLDINSQNHLNQIKKYIYEKGENINLDHISKINSELIKMIEIIEKKEKLKQTLENYNLKIEQNKQLLNELNELDDNENNYENNNNQYLDEVEEENTK